MDRSAYEPRLAWCLLGHGAVFHSFSSCPRVGVVTDEVLATSDGSSSGKRGGGGVSYDGLVPVHKEL